MELDEKVQCLIAVGASIGANCNPCLQSSIALAMQNGAGEWEIEAAKALGRMVRSCAAKMEKVAEGLKAEPPAPENESTTCCGLPKSIFGKEGQNE